MPPSTRNTPAPLAKRAVDAIIESASGFPEGRLHVQRVCQLHKLRVYVDTSVLGGISDEEFAEASRRFLDGVRTGRYIALVSEVVYRELAGAPEETRRALQKLPPGSLEEVAINAEVEELANAYVAADVLGLSAKLDAIHVAAATVAGADLILSWNFRHIVNYNRIRAYNSVNLIKGYHLMDIRSPQELGDADEDI